MYILITLFIFLFPELNIDKKISQYLIDGIITDGVGY